MIIEYPTSQQQENADLHSTHIPLGAEHCDETVGLHQENVAEFEACNTAQACGKVF